MVKIMVKGEFQDQIPILCLREYIEKSTIIK